MSLYELVQFLSWCRMLIMSIGRLYTGHCSLYNIKGNIGIWYYGTDEYGAESLFKRYCRDGMYFKVTKALRRAHVVYNRYNNDFNTN